MQLNKLFLCMFLCFDCVLIFNADRTLKISKIYKIECVSNPKMVFNSSCNLKAINWELSYANFDCDLKGEWKNITVRVELFKFANQFRPFLVNMTINLCKLLEKGTTSNIVGRAFLDIISPNSNVNHPCPYKGHITAYNLSISKPIFGLTLPYGKYRLDSTWFEGHPPISVGTIKAYVQVYEKKFEESRKKNIASGKLL